MSRSPHDTARNHNRISRIAFFLHLLARSNTLRNTSLSWWSERETIGGPVNIPKRNVTVTFRRCGALDEKNYQLGVIPGDLIRLAAGGGLAENQLSAWGRLCNTAAAEQFAT